MAATFAGDQPEPTLGAFLAYLAAAQQEEFGLETGRVGESDTVKLLTVHAAKGLQWPAVFVPGLAAGDRSQVFPARPRVSTRWTDNARLIPFPLRGDVADLPEPARRSRPTRSRRSPPPAPPATWPRSARLGYVAATRAAFWLGCSGYWWGDATAALGPSVFLDRGPPGVRGRRGYGRAVGGPAGRRRGEPAAGRGGRGRTGPPPRPAQHYAAVGEAAALVDAAASARAREPRRRRRCGRAAEGRPGRR